MKKPFDKIGLRLVLRKVSTPVGIGKATRSLYGDGLLGLVTTWRVFNCIRVKDGSVSRRKLYSTLAHYPPLSSDKAYAQFNDREEIYGSVQLVNHDTKSKLPLHGRVVAVLTPVQHTLPEELVNKFQKRCTGE